VLSFRSLAGVGELDRLIATFDSYVPRAIENLHSFIKPLIEAQSSVLGVSPDAFNHSAPATGFSRPRATLRAEIVKLPNSVLTIAVRAHGVLRADPARSDIDKGSVRITVAQWGSADMAVLTKFIADAEIAFAVELHQSSSATESSRRLRSEGFTPVEVPVEDEVAAARALSDPHVKAVATAVKSGGGLLVGDLAKNQTGISAERLPEIRTLLISTGIVASEIVLICGKTSQPVNRLNSVDDLAILSKHGVRCSCGKPVDAERVEEAFSITPRGAAMLDKSHWMTVLLVSELVTLGVDPPSIFVEQQIGGDELDCIAVINGDSVLFELKDGEFSLGHAYSFNSKIGVVRPDRSVIWTTNQVGNDARDHFERRRVIALESRRGRAADESSELGPTYIEGTRSLGSELGKIATELAAADARLVVRDLLMFAVATSDGLLQTWLEGPFEP